MEPTGAEMWFYIDDNGNFERVNTEADAIAGAKAALDACRELAQDDGWPDETRGICWGAIRQRVESTDIHRHSDECKNTDEDEDDSECLDGFNVHHDYIAEYGLVDVEVAK